MPTRKTWMKSPQEVALMLTMRRAHTERGQAVQSAALARVEAHIEASTEFRAACPTWISEALGGN